MTDDAGGVLPHDTDSSSADRHAGKPPEDRHPVGEGGEPDPSDYADPRVAQPGEDPPGEDALGDRRHRDGAD